ncbi:DPP IV N-terminal domain-containing protein, partial [uncultured Mucilaginibacter sp.]|uniref:S9 family peptidase n=1 Tax=uncultured Mucilaginibacter sp. TaxID=797541 RepID=UPI00261B7E7E
MNKLLRSGILVFGLTLGNEFAALAQQINAPALTANDYAHAEKMMAYNTATLVDYASVRPNWISKNQFWYHVLTPQGSRFMLVDAAKKTRAAAFDQEKLAASLSLATGKTYQANRLPFQNFSLSADQKSIIFKADGKQWKCDLTTYQCAADNSSVKKALNNEGGQQASGNEIISPDGTKAAFIKDYNLCVRDVNTSQQTALTTDGVKDYGYATDNAGWKQSESSVLLWSPDSKKIATFKQDQRKVSDMYLVSTNVGKPTLKAWKYPLPGDSVIAMIERVIINVDQPKVIRLQIPPDPHRATLSDDISSGGSFDDVDWNADASQLAFVSTSRDHKDEKVRIANAETGAVREVFEEKVATQFESGQGAINWRYLAKTNEILWYSERDNWGHLYLYNASTGKLKNQITKGNWVVTKLLNVDEKKRELYFMADGLEAENPYFSQLCKIGFDGKHFAVLTPEAGNHQVTFSPGNDYFIDSYSKPNVPPVTVLRDLNGKLLVNLEKADVSRLTASGWHAPIPITIKAHDGKTDLYGLMFTPTNLNAQKKYPVVDYIYPGPQGGSVGSWSFAASRGDNQALAELGFVVVEIEGTSNPLRSKSF